MGKYSKRKRKKAHSSTLPSLSFIHCRHLTSNTQVQKLTQKTLSSEYFFFCHGGSGFLSRAIGKRAQNPKRSKSSLISLSKMTPNEAVVPQANEVPAASPPRDEETALSEAASF